MHNTLIYITLICKPLLLVIRIAMIYSVGFLSIERIIRQYRVKKTFLKHSGFRIISFENPVSVEVPTQEKAQEDLQ